MDTRNMFTPSSQVFDCYTVGRVMLEGLRSQSDVEDEEDAWKWLRTPPRNTVLRVNTSQMSREEALYILDGLTLGLQYTCYEDTEVTFSNQLYFPLNPKFLAHNIGQVYCSYGKDIYQLIPIILNA